MNTPPYEDEINEFNTMMCNLPRELVDKKMERLHFAIVEHLNIIPVCFRAGRRGFNGGVAQIIKNLGYKIDSSISPFVDWSEYHGPDFSRGHSKAYMFEPDNLMEPSQNGSLLEVPPTVGFYQINGRFCYSLRKRLRGESLSRLHLLGILDRMRLLNFR
jgi:hypothetical protein